MRWILVYRGREGMWAWLLHRVTGIGILVFLLAHIVDISLMGWGPKIFDRMVILYTHPVFRIGEIILAGALIYHAMNGLRIVVIDFRDGLQSSGRKLFIAAGMLTLLLFIPTAALMLYDMLH